MHHFFYSLSSYPAFADFQNHFHNQSPHQLQHSFFQYSFLQFTLVKDKIQKITFINQSSSDLEKSFSKKHTPFNSTKHFSILQKEENDSSHDYDKIYKEIVEQMDQYGLAKKSLNLNYELNGTEILKKIWQEMALIPYGEVVSYSELAIKIFNNKHYSRVVAMACKRNPLMILIPCHRVIGSNKSLRGYVYGVETKRLLLIHEGVKIEV